MTRPLLMTAITPDYDASIFLDTVSIVRSCDVIVVVVGSQSEAREFRRVRPWLEIRDMSLPSDHSFSMLHHGAFLDAVPELVSDDLVFFVDADIEVQRDFTSSEIACIRDMTRKRAVAAYYNDGPDDTFEAEAGRIGLNSLSFPNGRFYNIGVMATTVATWHRVRQVYQEQYARFYEECTHRSRNQYLLNSIFRSESIGGVVELPRAVHRHGHFGHPLDTQYRGRVITTTDNDPVVFLHKMPKPGEGERA